MSKKTRTPQTVKPIAAARRNPIRKKRLRRKPSLRRRAIRRPSVRVTGVVSASDAQQLLHLVLSPRGLDVTADTTYPDLFHR